MQKTTDVSAMIAADYPALRRGRPRRGRGDRVRGGRGARARNVGTVERALSITGGGLLAVYGLGRRGVPGTALALTGAALVLRGVTGRCRVYEALGVDHSDHAGERGRSWLVQQHGPSAVLDARRAERVVRSVTVARPRAELYAYWRDLENLPRIMRHVESVTVLDERRSRWTTRGPAGRTVEWEAVINHEREDELIGWKSAPGADVPNAGSVRFTDTPDGRGTEILVTLEYVAPGGAVGAAVARLLGDDPGRQIDEDLRLFRSTMERQGAERQGAEHPGAAREDHPRPGSEPHPAG